MRLSKNKLTVQRQIDRLQEHLDSLYAAEVSPSGRNAMPVNPALVRFAFDSMMKGLKSVESLNRASSNASGDPISVRMPVRFV